MRSLLIALLAFNFSAVVYSQGNYSLLTLIQELCHQIILMEALNCTPLSGHIV